MRSVIFFHLFCLTVEVLSQEFPHITFDGETKSNHSYVDLLLVGNARGNSDAVVCETDLETCCSVGEGQYRGDWFFPSGEWLPFKNRNDDPVISEGRTGKKVVLHRNSDTNLTSGIYRCVIPTNTTPAVNTSVYIGLYVNGGIYSIIRYSYSIRYILHTIMSMAIAGDISIAGGINVTVEESHEPFKFTLTCISTGGPATTVTWTRDSVNITEGTETLLDDPVTARYTHTLTVIGRLGGLYECTVANNKPSMQVANITIGGKKSVNHIL